VPEANSYRCPGGELLPYSGLSRGAQGYVYRANPSQCASCSHKPACTPTTHRTLTVNWFEDVREHVRILGQTPEFAPARRARNKIEALFSELRNQIRLRKLRLRGLPRAGEQFLLEATVQNMKRYRALRIRFPVGQCRIARRSTTILKRYVFRRTVSSFPISFVEAGSVMLPCD
jgi:Transposase DDE domain